MSESYFVRIGEIYLYRGNSWDKMLYYTRVAKDLMHSLGATGTVVQNQGNGLRDFHYVDGDLEP